ncbi:unnamed protein product, partial [marine sediment metagenome]
EFTFYINPEPLGLLVQKRPGPSSRQGGCD